ncbi:hypothetical protein EWI07_08745 [Sporolactobacillus sp. THM7-4]|nr:hypothetical protein EWI07_08745 [Sporolactobacillus sp. THM7-4]
MKKVLVINPNTSSTMTESIRQTVCSFQENINVTVVNPPEGPESLESFYDYHIAAFEIIKLIQSRRTNYDGILISCFGDPGLYAVKEISDCLVVGIAEASLSASLLLGKKFSVITALKKAVPMMEDMITQYGFSCRCSGIRPVNLNVLEIENRIFRKFIKVGNECLRDGAEVIILGCASMTGLKDRMEEALGVPVIDPVQVGFQVLLMMIKAKMHTSKAGLYMAPPKGLYPLN